MPDESVTAASNLAEAHLEAAKSHDSAAHHHRQASFYVTVGDGAKARQHAIVASEHAAGAQQVASEKAESWDDYDLDVDFQSLEAGEFQPQVTSKSLCTPTCNMGTGRSFCCSGFGIFC